MIRSALTVDSQVTLQRLRAEVWRIGPRRFSDIRVAVPGLSHESNASYTMQFRALYFACGCNEGKLGAGLGLVGLAIWVMSTSDGLATLSLRHLFAAAILVGATALLGKFAALGAARRILSRSLDQLESEIATATKAGSGRAGEPHHSP